MILLLIVTGSISLIHGMSWWLARKKWPEESPLEINWEAILEEVQK